MKLSTVELFSGTKSFSKVMYDHGHDTFTVDNDPSLAPTLCASVLDLAPNMLPYRPKVLWASPPCTAFSVASIGRHWGGGFRAYEPKTSKAKLGMELVESTIEYIEKSKPKWWFIENPRGVLRKLPFMIEAIERLGGVRRTVWYCRYGDTRAKPTDIWTNATWWVPRPACKNGNLDHEAAPRGAKTGTQGIDGAKDRGRIPPALFEELLEQMPDVD